MPEEIATSPGAAVTSGPPTITYPEDYEELKSYRDRYNQLSESLSPYIDDIRPIIEDEDQRNFWRNARETYQERLKKQEPQLDPTFQPLVKHFEDRLGPLVEYVESDRKAKADAKAAKDAEDAAAKAASDRANLEYAQRLAAERPDLAEDNYAGIGMLAAYAANRGMSLEEAWKAKGSVMSAPPKREKPPTSLRGDAAAPGVPGESTAPPIRSGVDLRKRLASNLRAAGMKG